MGTELWGLVEEYKNFDTETRSRIMGYVEAMASIKNSTKTKKQLKKPKTKGIN